MLPIRITNAMRSSGTRKRPIGFVSHPRRNPNPKNAMNNARNSFARTLLALAAIAVPVYLIARVVIMAQTTV